MVTIVNIEMIGPDKLRVVLNLGDLNRYELDYSSIRSESPETRELVRDILAQAKSDTGFSTRNSKLLIEVVPGKNKGCVLYLTRLPLTTHLRTGRQEPDTRSKSGEYILSCTTFDDTIGAVSCFAAYPDIPLRKSSLYDCDGRYHLIFAPVRPGLDGQRLASLLASLSEYGSAQQADPIREAMLAEHGRAISGTRAVEKMLRFFS